MQSVRSGSDFWASGHHTESSGEFTAAQLSSSPDPQSPVAVLAQIPRSGRVRGRRNARHPDSDEDSSSDSDGTQIAARAQASNVAGNGAAGAGAGGGAPPMASASSVNTQAAAIDEVGAHDAFVAGMMYALSRRMLPGDPYTPSAVIKDGNNISVHGVEAERDRGKWRLEECLRYVLRVVVEATCLTDVHLLQVCN